MDRLFSGAVHDGIRSCLLCDTCVHDNQQISTLPSRVRVTKDSVEEASVNVHVRTEASTSAEIVLRLFNGTKAVLGREVSNVVRDGVFRLSRPCEVSIRLLHAPSVCGLNVVGAFRLVIQRHSRGGERTKDRF